MHAAISICYNINIPATIISTYGFINIFGLQLSAVGSNPYITIYKADCNTVHLDQCLPRFTIPVGSGVVTGKNGTCYPVRFRFTC